MTDTPGAKAVARRMAAKRSAATRALQANARRRNAISDPPICDHCDAPAIEATDYGRGRVLRRCALHANVRDFGR